MSHVKKCRALVLDDQEPMRHYLSHVLEELGYTVSRSCDGEQGLRLFYDKRFHLVVTDICMPGKDGIEVVIEMRRIYPPVPIVALSGVDSRERLLMLAGMFEADATLRKPFLREELVAAIRKAVGKRTERENVREY